MISAATTGKSGAVDDGGTPMGHSRDSKSTSEWPALMSISHAARYLSIDEDKFLELAIRKKLAPVDLGEPIERWRKSDIDQLLSQLSILPLENLEFRTGRGMKFDPHTISTLADAIAGKLGTYRSDSRPRYLSVAESVEFLGIGKTTLYRMIAEGLLPTHRIGRRTLIRREDLERAI